MQPEIRQLITYDEEASIKAIQTFELENVSS